MATQEHVSETLRRAVATGRVGHAYLFCGPRGVGKTTLARVLAMALNCANRTEEGEPCGACESCTRIWGGHTALDVVEIDAASNRGVDDARDLRERAMYAPSAEDRSKIYIIDEAHMLTREAWNALLKILEEPPPRVVFIFATTEPQKINQFAAPILSRCQRFDFRRIGLGDIVSRLASVLEQEGAAGPEDALRIIARKADGGMRDALSLLDQVLALTGGDVDAESVRRVLGLVEEDRYVELLDVLRERKHDRVFELVERLVDEGYDLVEFYHGLLDVLRALLRLRLSPETPLDLPEGLRAQLVERAADFEPGDLVRMLSAAAELENQGSLRRTPNPRLPIEMLLLRMSFLDRTVDVEQLIRTLGGAPPRGTGGPVAGTGETTRRATRGAVGTNVTTTGSPAGDAAEANAATAGRPAGDVAEEKAESDSAAGAFGPSARTVESGPPTHQTGNGLSAGAPGALGAGAPVAVSARPSVSDQSAAPRGDRIEPSASALEGWNRWLEAGAGVPAGLTPFLRSALVTEGPDGSLAVTMPPGPGIDRVGEVGVLARMRQGLEPYVGRTPELRISSSDVPSGGAGPLTEEAVREDTLRALYRQEPRLRRAVEELDLELMD